MVWFLTQFFNSDGDNIFSGSQQATHCQGYIHLISSLLIAAR